jgi:hypothetical protein
MRGERLRIEYRDPGEQLTVPCSYRGGARENGPTGSSASADDGSRAHHGSSCKRRRFATRSMNATTFGESWRAVGARAKTVPALGEALGGHGGGTAVATAWEFQLLGAHGR